LQPCPVLPEYSGEAARCDGKREKIITNINIYGDKCFISSVPARLYRRLSDYIRNTGYEKKHPTGGGNSGSNGVAAISP
jgi:hypothetical protein